MPDTQSPYDQIRPAIDELATERYRGNRDAAFRHWAFKMIFLDQQFEDEEVEEYTQIDAPGDLGVDGYWPDRDARVVALYQSKHLSADTSIATGLLASFKGVVEALFDPEFIATSQNAAVLDLHRELTSQVCDAGFGLRLVFATSAVLGRQARQFVQSIQGSDVRVRCGADVRACPLAFEAFDVSDLAVRAAEDNEPPIEATDVDIPRADARYHVVEGPNKTVYITLPAAEVVKAYRRYGGALFERNVPVPLGNNKVNR